jgi:hypothetical protein
MDMTKRDETGELDQWLAGLEDGHAEARDAAELRAIGEAVIAVEGAQEDLVRAVAAARAADWSWTMIANVLGVSRQAARQRFGDAVRTA